MSTPQPDQIGQDAKWQVMGFMIKLSIVVQALSALEQAKNVSNEDLTRIAIRALLPAMGGN